MQLLNCGVKMMRASLSLFLMFTFFSANAHGHDEGEENDRFAAIKSYEKAYRLLRDVDDKMQRSAKMPLVEINSILLAITAYRTTNRDLPPAVEYELLGQEYSVANTYLREVAEFNSEARGPTDRKLELVNLKSIRARALEAAEAVIFFTNLHFSKDVEKLKSNGRLLLVIRDPDAANSCDRYYSAIERIRALAPDDMTVVARELQPCYPAKVWLDNGAYALSERKRVAQIRIEWLITRKPPDPIADVNFIANVYTGGRFEDGPFWPVLCKKNLDFETRINILHRRFPMLVLPIPLPDDLDLIDQHHFAIGDAMFRGDRINVPIEPLRRIGRSDAKIAYDAFAKLRPLLLEQLVVSCVKWK